MSASICQPVGPTITSRRRHQDKIQSLEKELEQILGSSTKPATPLLEEKAQNERGRQSQNRSRPKSEMGKDQGCKKITVLSGRSLRSATLRCEIIFTPASVNGFYDDDGR